MSSKHYTVCDQFNVCVQFTVLARHGDASPEGTYYTANSEFHHCTHNCSHYIELEYEKLSLN